MTAFPNYTTGTVAVANGATAIVGTSTIWSGVNARAGDDIVINGNTVIIQDVTDPTHLVIDAWPYATVAAGATYKIIQRSPFRFAGGQVMADVSSLVAAFNTDGFYVFVSSALTVPDPSLGNNGQYAFQASTGKLWIKTGGVWNFLGVYTGFSFLGAWSGATAYGINQVVTLGGSSYICILAHTNFTPPNATYWSLLASIGNTGGTGPTGAAGTNGTNGIGYAGTSTTSLLIATGSKVFTTQAGLGYNGARVRAASNANPVNYMEGICTYSGTTLTMTVDAVGGSGTPADWVLSIAGQPGSAGAGALLAANNLSDVVNAATARNNLGVYKTLSAGSDLNLLKTPGFFDGNTLTNSPDGTTSWFYIDVVLHSFFTAGTNEFVVQRAYTLSDAATPRAYIRWEVSNAWTAWQRVLLGSNNLSEVANAATARANIGAGTVASIATAGIATGGPITGSGTVTVTAAVKSDQTTASSTAVAVVPAV